MKKLLLFLILVFSITIAYGQQGWYLQNSNTLKNLNSVFCINANKVLVAGDSGTILKTTNGGTNWNPANSTTNKKFRAIFFADSLTGYAIGDSGTIVKTIDGGSTWNQQVSHSKSQLNTLFFTSKDTGYIMGMLPATYIKTVNGGANWKVDLTFGPCCAYLNSLTFISKKIGLCLGYDMAGTFILSTTDTGRTWSNCVIDPNWQWMGTALTLADTVSSGVVAGTQSFIQSGGGCNYLNWHYFGGGYGSTDFNSICKHKDPASFATTIAVGTNGVYPNNPTTNCCQSSGVTSNLNSVIFADSLIGYIVGDSGVILKTINGGDGTGIYENNLQNELSIYPNPTNGKFQIQMDNGKLSIENYQLSIYNVYGEKVFQSANLQISKSIIDLSSQPNGIYFLQLKTEQGVAVKKLMISR